MLGITAPKLAPGLPGDRDPPERDWPDFCHFERRSLTAGTLGRGLSHQGQADCSPTTGAGWLDMAFAGDMPDATPWDGPEA